MPKKKPTRKPTSKKSAAPKKRAAKSSGTPAPVDPIQAALARRRAALIRR